MTVGNALLVAPQPFTVSSADQSSLQPATNLNLNQPSLIWSSPSATTAQITILGAGQYIDTIALIGSNLSASDTVTIKYATSVANLTSATETTINAYSGAALGGNYSTKTVYQYAAPIAFNAVQIKVTSSAAKVFTAQRIVIGAAVSTAGIDYGAEMSFVDRSVPLSGSGWASYQPFAVVPTWKVTCSWIPSTWWRSSWLPFLQAVGTSQPFVFVPNINDPHPSEVVFGPMAGNPGKGDIQGYDAWSCDMQIVALAP